MKDVASAVAYRHRRGFGVLRNYALGLTAIFATLGLSACSSSETCDFPDQTYTTARSVPPLKVPGDLDQPNRSGSLSIPTQSKPKPKSKACLDRPPSFFATAKAAPVEVDPEQVVTNWAQAWADRDADALLALYAPSYQAEAGSNTAEDWREKRREQIVNGPIPDSKLDDFKVESPSPDRRVISFVHRFGANSFQKQLILTRENGEWRIVAERLVASAAQ
jgi:hypothetical protein